MVVRFLRLEHHRLFELDCEQLKIFSGSTARNDILLRNLPLTNQRSKDGS
jgi:hypothetical protein